MLVQNGQNNNLNKLTFLERGYTGHEHLQGVDLINMNARLYDAKLHRFLAPDNFIQDPSNSQNYNRYGYVLNNPLKHNDPSGEFIFTVLNAIVDTFRAVFNGHFDYSRTTNAWRIDTGMFRGTGFDVASRFTWQSTQSHLGNTVNNVLNIFGKVTEVTNLEGATAVATTLDGGAFTMGSYITGPENFRADWRDHLFVHEYGHYIQSKIFGPLYLSAIALPSFFDFSKEKDRHRTRWYEAQASSLGGKYFDKRYGSGVPGYDPTSDQFFDLNAFKTPNVESLYDNPRLRDHNRSTGHTSHYRIHWSDLIYALHGRIL